MYKVEMLKLSAKTENTIKKKVEVFPVINEHRLIKSDKNVFTGCGRGGMTWHMHTETENGNICYANAH